MYIYIYMTNGRNHPADLKFDHPSVHVTIEIMDFSEVITAE